MQTLDRPPIGARATPFGLRPAALRWPFHAVELQLGPVALDGYTAELSGTMWASPGLAPHAQVDAIRVAHERWAWAIGLAPAPVVERLHLWDLWTDCVPAASVEVASIVPDYCLLFTIMDDAAERYFSQSSMAEPAGALGDVVRVIDGKAPERGAAVPYPNYEALLAVADDLRARILACDPSPATYAFFIDGMDRYRRGVVQQIYMSQRGIPMSRETQLYNRLLNVAMDPTLTLLCMLDGVDLGAGLREHPLLERLHVAASRLSAAMNDIVSFPKEVQQGLGHSQYHNLVSATFGEFARMDHIPNPLAIAIARSFDFHNHEFRDVLELGADLAEGLPHLARYVRIGLDAHRSFLAWCLSADRYRSAMGGGEAIASDRPVGAPWATDGSVET